MMNTLPEQCYSQIFRKYMIYFIDFFQTCSCGVSGKRSRLLAGGQMVQIHSGALFLFPSRDFSIHTITYIIYCNTMADTMLSNLYVFQRRPCLTQEKKRMSTIDYNDSSAFNAYLHRESVTLIFNFFRLYFQTLSAHRRYVKH